MQISLYMGLHKIQILQLHWGKKYDNKDFNESLFLRGVSQSILLDRDMRSKNSGVVFNFGLHMVRSLSMERSMKLFERFLSILKNI